LLGFFRDNATWKGTVNVWINIIVFQLSFMSESEIGITTYCLSLRHATKTCWRRTGNAPHILSLDIRTFYGILWMQFLFQNLKSSTSRFARKRNVPTADRTAFCS
jgi:hypothetical protein